MNTKTLLLGVLVVGIGICSGIIITSLQKKTPQMAYENNECDFGVVAPRTKMSHSFKFTNSGNQSLIIKEIKTTCGCTVASVSRNFIPPKKSASLDLEFSASKNKGERAYPITVVTNEPTNFHHKFYMKATIVPRIELQPEVINVGQLHANELPIKKHIKISTDKKEAVSVRSGLKFIRADIKYADDTHHDLYLTIDGNTPIGPLSSKIYIEIQGEDPLTLQIPILGQIIGEVYAEPTTVFWGVVEEGDSARETVRLKANQGYLKVERFNASDSIKSILAIDIKKENVGAALNIDLRPQTLEEGRRKAKKVEGFIRVFVKIEKENSHDEESNQGVPKNIDSLLEVNIPVLFFVATHP
jgi:hypothetical protein